MAKKTAVAAAQGKIEKFDRATAQAVSKRVEEALRSIALEFGCTLIPAGGTFEDASYTCRIKFALAEVGGVSVEEATFKKHCAVVGLKPEDFGAKFVVPGGEARIIGLKPGAGKRPIVFEFIANPGKKYVCEDAYVRKQLGRKFAWEEKGYDFSKDRVPAPPMTSTPDGKGGMTVTPSTDGVAWLEKTLGEAGWFFPAKGEQIGFPLTAPISSLYFKDEDSVGSESMGPVFARLADGKTLPLVTEKGGSAKWFMLTEAKKVAALLRKPLTDTVA